MVAHGVVDPHELRVAGEDRGGDVVDLAADEPAHRHVQFEVDDVELRAAEERLAEDVLLRRLAHAGRKPATIASRAALFSASPMRIVGVTTARRSSTCCIMPSWRAASKSSAG